jgi:protein Mpv17
MASAFSTGGSFHQNTPMIATRLRPLPRYHTKAFMRTDSSRLMSDDVKMIVEDLREEDIKEYPPQDGQVKMDLKSVVGTGIAVAGSLALLVSLLQFYGAIDASGMKDFQEAAMKVPSDIWERYMEILNASPIQTKAVTSATVYTIGDVISQRTEGTSMDEIDTTRTFRSLLAGLIGHGPLSHCWYEFSENLFNNVLHLPNDAFGTIAKVAIDQTTWGPFWNNTYILLLGLMKFDSFGNIFSEMKRTTIPLIVSGLKLWPLAHCVTYGLVPLENRLLWVDLVEIIWVTILATAAAGKSTVEGEQEVKPQN